MLELDGLLHNAMSFSLIHRCSDAIRRVFQREAQKHVPLADVLTARLADSPDFLFKIGYSSALGQPPFPRPPVRPNGSFRVQLADSK